MKEVPEVLADSVGFLLSRAGKRIRDRQELALRKTGITPQELGLLRIIDGEAAMTQQQLSLRYDVDRTTMVQLIDGLEHKKLVTRVRDTYDRRCYRLHITGAGKKVLAQGKKLIAQEQQSFLAGISESEWKTLKSVLVKLLTDSK